MFQQIIVEGNPEVFKSDILNFLSGFPDAVFLDSNNNGSVSVPYTGIKYNYIAAAGVLQAVHSSTNTLNELENFISSCRERSEWVFGFLSYDLKNEIEHLSSENKDAAGFPLFHFFSAQHIFLATETQLTVIDTKDAGELWKKITASPEKSLQPEKTRLHISYRLSRDAYYESVKHLLEHIHHGNIYEINYCHELVAKVENLDPVTVFHNLTAASPNPFSCYYKTGNMHLMCVSPERFLAKRGNMLISQPVKGTAARGKTSVQDALNKKQLTESEKERSENVMIVDLVRNDLSKVAETGSVKVEELFGIYTFPKVHQMISTVSCVLKKDVTFMEVIRALFPMGSMTGAPKVSAMKLIDRFETFKRGLFSGTTGYIDPDGDFDFNVVIRSILYNENKKIATLAAGGAITAASIPEQEFLETMVKLSPQLEALGINNEEIFKEIRDGNIV